MSSVERTVSGWGRFPAPRSAQVRRPDRASRVGDALGEPACPRGLGRSYGDAASADTVVLTCDLDRLLAFDEDTGLLTAEAGVSLDTVISTFLPRGWFLPVTPGTRFISLGGAVAADVHGKSHPTSGSFGDHVQSLVLRTADGARRTLTPEDPLFAATVGGMGLTGVIEELTLPLVRIPSAYVSHTKTRGGSLAETLALLRGAEAPKAIAWFDVRRGRGWVDTADHAPADAAPGEPHDVRPRPPRPLPFTPPGWALNRLVLAAHSWWLWRDEAGVVDLYRYTYPLDAIADWHRLFSPGLFQYQAALPDAHADDAIARLLEAVDQPCYLATIKRLGGEGRGLLSFPLHGLTIALDFKATPAAIALASRLDDIVSEAGGRLYLAKDPRCPRETFAKMEGERLERWLAIKREVDPDNRLTSDLGVRLGLVPS